MKAFVLLFASSFAPALLAADQLPRKETKQGEQTSPVRHNVRSSGSLEERMKENFAQLQSSSRLLAEAQSAINKQLAEIQASIVRSKDKHM